MIDLLHVVLLQTCAVSFAMTVSAGTAAMDIHPADTEDTELMPMFLCCFAEYLDHVGCTAFCPGTAVEYEYVHASPALLPQLRLRW